MIRLIQRRLIVPRGDTGTFSIPVLAGKNVGDVAIFTIFNQLTHKKIFEKVMELSGEALTMELSHGDTVNLPVGQFVWDIKFYSNPTFADGRLVDGEEVDSYYAAFTLPVCEIRETGDNLLFSDEAPQATLSPGQIDYITASINEVTSSKNAAASSAAEADTSATNAGLSASAASASESAALAAQQGALTAQQAAQQAAQEAADAARALIDDTAGTGDVDKVWSADKLTTTVSGIGQDIYQMAVSLSNEIDAVANYAQTKYTKPANGIPASDLEETYLTSFTEIDPTVPEWAKQAQKPNYTAAEVGAPTIQEMNNGLAEKIESFIVNLTYKEENHTVTSDKTIDSIVEAYKDKKDIQARLYTIYENEEESFGFTSLSYNIITAQRTPEVVENTIYFRFNSDPTTTVIMGASSTGYNDFWIMISSNYLSSEPTFMSPYSENNNYNADNNKIINLANPTDNKDAVNKQYVDSAIPTNVSELTNDAGYLTSFTETDPTVPAWAKASTKPTYTAAEVGAPTVQEMNTAIGTAIGNIHQFDIQVVQALPTQDIQEHTVYFVPKTGETNDVYDEYIYINNAWEMIGNTQIDLSNYVQKTDYATSSTAGVVKVGSAYGINISPSGVLNMVYADDSDIQNGSSTYKTITPRHQSTSVFYGLANAAGDTTQSQSNNAVGTYTNDAKNAIRTMLGAAASSDIPNVPVQDVQINGSSIINANGEANIPYATASSAGLAQAADGLMVSSQGDGKLMVNKATDSQIKAGLSAYYPIVPGTQEKATFYGLAKAAGDATQAASDNAVGTYTADAKGAIQTMLGITDALATKLNAAEAGMRVVRLI